MSTCGIREPKNGMYLTEKDNTNWPDTFSRLLVESGQSQIKEGDFDRDVKNISILLTEKCNLRCSYCYQSHEDHAGGKSMTKETAREVVDFLLDDNKGNNYINSNKSQGVVLDMLGGEPFYDIDLLDYFIDYFKVKAVSIGHPWGTNYMISISTNGTLYHTKKVRDFVEKNKGRLSIGLSIDGNKKLHDSCRVFPDGSGSFDIVRENADIWMSDFCKPNTKVTLAPENLSYLKESVIDLWNMGIATVHANPIYEAKWNEDQANIYYNELKNLADYLLEEQRYKIFWTNLFSELIGKKIEGDINYCGGNGQMLAIGPDGRCYPCLRYMEHSLKGKQKPIQIGDIKNGLDDPEKNSDIVELRSITMKTQSDDKCNGCEIASGCGTCSAYNYEVTGSANKRVTNTCLMHQARTLANSYYWNKLYEKLAINKKFDLNIPRDWALKIIDEKELNELITMQGG